MGTIECSNLIRGQFVRISDRPCKIVDIISEDSGDLKIVGNDMFSNEQFEMACNPTENVSLLELQTAQYEVLGKCENFLSVVDETGENIFDIEIPAGNVGEQIIQYFGSEDTLPNANVEILSCEALDLKAIKKFWIGG